MTKVPEVPGYVWEELYAAAGRFYELKPWDIVDAMLKNIVITTKIFLKDKKAAAALAPLGKALGIVFEHKKRLQSIINARRGLDAATRGRGFMP